MDEGETTDDRFLGGKLLLRQLKKGHRAGHDAILLAASTAAKAGERVVDLGAGVGAAGLALAERVPGIVLTLVEIDPGIAALAAHNASVNGIAAQIVTADVASLGDALSRETFDAVLMNPPFHDAARHRASPNALRRTAHVALEDTLPVWIDAAHRLMKSGGALTMVWRTDGLGDVLAALGPRFGSIQLQAVHAARTKPAIRILVRAIKGGRNPLVIHDGAFLDSDDVQHAMRGESALTLALR